MSDPRRLRLGGMARRLISRQRAVFRLGVHVQRSKATVDTEKRHDQAERQRNDKRSESVAVSELRKPAA